MLGMEVVCLLVLMSWLVYNSGIRVGLKSLLLFLLIGMALRKLLVFMSPYLCLLNGDTTTTYETVMKLTGLITEQGPECVS